jgi:hypothetical protein
MGGRSLEFLSVQTGIAGGKAKHTAYKDKAKNA